MINKIVLLTIMFAVSYDAAWAATTAVSIAEVTGALDMSVNGLKTSITLDADDILDDDPAQVNIEATGGSGSGAKFSLVGHGSTTNGVVTITCTDGGTGYKEGDVLTLTNKGTGSNTAHFITSTTDGSKGNIEITLSADDISRAGLVGTLNALALSITLDSTHAITTGDGGNGHLSKASTNSGSGIGAKFDIKGDGTKLGIIDTDGTIITGAVLTVVEAGVGYKIGDVLTIAASEFGGTGNIEITLTAGDINGLVKVTPTDGFFRNSVGGPFNINGNFVNTKLLGYYLALSKAAHYISVTATFDTGDTVVPSINDESDTSLVSTAYSKLLPVKDGLNMLKLVTSAHGTFEMNLIKPDDEIKVTRAGKRSIEIAYNPASVGELTCAAFEYPDAGTVTDPTTLAAINDDATTNIVVKSRRTHNVLQKNIFHSVQMTLNGLTPSKEHEIHCHHFIHGIISHNADGLTDTMTDLATLTSVSLQPDNLLGKRVGVTTGVSAGIVTTWTLKFTHEISLKTNAVIKLRVYNDYSGVQALTAGTGTACGGQLAITSKASGSSAVASDVTGDHTCAEDADSNDILEITLKGDSTVSSGSAGNEVVIILTDDDSANELNLAVNEAEGTKVTFDLEVTGHGKLLQQPGWTTQ